MKTIGVVIAAYNPERNLVERVRGLVAEGASVLVVDDASHRDDVEGILADIAAAGAEVIRESVNAGIGRSLNRGRQWAISSGFDFLMTLDQDSQLPAGYLEKVLRLAADLESAGVPVGIVAPGVVSGIAYRGVPIGHDVESIVLAIQSASVYPVAVLRNLGAFREDFVMDCVDLEYCLRLRRSGLEVLSAPELEIEHVLGTPVVARVFGRAVRRRGRPLVVHLHSDTRKYYMVRNRILLAMEYRSDRPWLAIYRREYVRDIVLTLGFGNARLRALSTICRATYHGLRKMSGPRASVSPMISPA